jgi:hypothetical protein
MPRRFYFRITESDAAGFAAGIYKSAAMARVINAFPGGDPDVIDPTILTPHPTAGLVERFGGEAPDYTTWKAGLGAKYESHSVNDTKCSFDAVRTFNGYSSLKVTGSGAANLYKTIAEVQKAWIRSFVWIDTAHVFGNDIYLGGLIFHNAAFPHPAAFESFPGDIVYVHDDWETGLPGFASYDYDAYDTNALGSKAFDDVKGFWLPIVQFAELAAVSRYRLWLPGMSGTPLINSTWSVADMSTVEFNLAQLAFSSGATGSQVNYGLVEYHFGDNPYGLITP